MKERSFSLGVFIKDVFWVRLSVFGLNSIFFLNNGETIKVL